MKMTASPSASPIESFDSLICRTWPSWWTLAPGGSLIFAKAAFISGTISPSGRFMGDAQMTICRSRSSRSMTVGPSPRSIFARSPMATRPFGVHTVIRRTSSTVSRSADVRRTRMGISSFPWRILPASSPSIAVRSVRATSWTGTPSLAARSRSTVTRSSGRPGSNFSCTSVTPGIDWSADSNCFASGSSSSYVGARTCTMIGASVCAPSTNDGSVTDTSAPGAIFFAISRAFALSATTPSTRWLFGTATTRQLILLVSPFGPIVDRIVMKRLSSRSSFSAASESRAVSSSDVPAGSVISATNCPRSSSDTNSVPVYFAMYPIPTSDPTASRPTTALCRTAQPSVCR